MISILSFKTRGCKRFLTTIVILVLIGYSQMGTHVPGFQSLFLAFLHHFVIARLATRSIRVMLGNVYPAFTHLTATVDGPNSTNFPSSTPTTTRTIRPKKVPPGSAQSPVRPHSTPQTTRTLRVTARRRASAPWGGQRTAWRMRCGMDGESGSGLCS